MAVILAFSYRFHLESQQVKKSVEFIQQKIKEPEDSDSLISKNELC